MKPLKTFKPATIGITGPHLDKMGGPSAPTGKSMAPAAKSVRRANRAGVIGRAVTSRSL